MKWPTGRTLGGISTLGQRPGTRLGQFQDGQFTSAGLHDFTASLRAAGYRTPYSWLYLVVLWRKQSQVPGGRAHVGLSWVRRLLGLGRNQGGSSTRTKIQTPPAKW